MTAEEEVWLKAELLRRAASRFEQAEMWRDAAECWADLGQPGRAGELYARGGHLHLAAPALLAAGRNAEALDLYRTWETSLPASDLPNRVKALLGQAACCLLPPPPEGSGPVLSEVEGVRAYRQARALLEAAQEQDHLAAARCWTALAEYGHQMGRFNLLHEGYELALAHYEKTAAVAEKIATGRAYLAAARDWNDRLVVQSLEERLAAWGDWPGETEAPAWQQQQALIEQHPFRDGGRDVLHFTTPEQWAAWRKLAEMENKPEADDYLRSLAPPDMIYIPPGPFLMGTTEEEVTALLETAKDWERELIESEKPQHELWLRGYYIDRYPVTNAQYRQFVEAGGYRQQEYWTEAGWAEKESKNWQEPRYWDDERFNGDKQPVVGVSWYEAVAYARWAGKVLPGEAEWEKAAGWNPVAGQKRKYPWGDEWDEDKSNSGGKHEQTTDVGSYPEDQSAYGLLDVGGNVFEWCSTRWRDEAGKQYEYPYDDQDGREDLAGGNEVWRVVKGSPWWGSSDDARKWERCGFRFWNYPRYRNDIWGFRCLTPDVISP